MRQLIRIIQSCLFAVGEQMGRLLSGPRFVGRALSAVLPIEFVSQWLFTRKYKRLLFGAPALLGLIALTAGAVYAMIPSEPESLNHYVDQAYEARQDGETKIADLYMRKATMAKPDSPAARFKQAFLLGQSDSAMEIIRELAPVDGKGYLPARAAMINAIGADLLTNLQKTDPTPEDIARRTVLYQEMETQAKKVLDEVPESAVENVTTISPGSDAAIRALALEKLALIQLDRGDGAGALIHLAQLVHLNPEANLLYGKLLAAKGDQKQADEAVQRAINYHQKILAKQELPPERKHAHTIQMASGLALLGQYEQAAISLLDNQELPTDAPRRAALGDIFYAWSESVKASSDLTDEASTVALSKKLELLDKALQLRPSDTRILQRIATIAGTEGESGKKAKLAMKQVLATGKAPAVVHFVLGVNELQAGNVEKSRAHLELANKVSPNTPVTLNNLAYLLSKQDPPDLVRALSMIDQAIELNRTIPEFYDTRGVIYVMMERWTDAISDLERALKAGVKNEKILHESLAKSYTAIGDDDLARMHRELAAKVTAP